MKSVKTLKDSVMFALILIFSTNSQETTYVWAPVVYIIDVGNNSLLRIPPKRVYLDSLAAVAAINPQVRTIKPHITLETVVERYQLIGH